MQETPLPIDDYARTDPVAFVRLFSQSHGSSVLLRPVDARQQRHFSFQEERSGTLMGDVVANPTRTHEGGRTLKAGEPVSRQGTR